MRRVWLAITAKIAVEERASKECLRHHGYASAIQNVSNPASAQALAMATVSRTGSMLSCRTPMLNGMVIVQVSGLRSQVSGLRSQEKQKARRVDVKSKTPKSAPVGFS